MSGIPRSRVTRLRDRLRRGRREWRNDAGVAIGGLGLGGLLLLATISDDPQVSEHVPSQMTAGVIAALAVLLFRRSHPTQLAVVFTVLGFVFVPVTGSAVASFFSVASYRRARTALLAVGLHAALTLALFRVEPVSWSAYWQAVGTFLFLDTVALTCGMLVRSLEARARQAENEQRLRVDEARHLERERIAREMHDVLAHRISLLAVHAGALEFRAGASPEEARAAGVIRQCAHDALEDLRDVIRMLRTEETGTTADADDSDRPQPTLADLPALIEQSRRAGTVVEFGFAPVGEDAAERPRAERGTEPAEIPARLGRHAYRIVQEGLTNARKHAPGEPVRVRVDTGGASGLRVEVVNALRSAPARTDPIPGAGAGLIGLTERVTLVGGRLEHGPESGEFRLRAWLPWTS